MLFGQKRYALYIRSNLIWESERLQHLSADWETHARWMSGEECSQLCVVKDRLRGKFVAHAELLRLGFHPGKD
jgi:hypothetical protein